MWTCGFNRLNTCNRVLNGPICASKMTEKPGPLKKIYALPKRKVDRRFCAYINRKHLRNNQPILCVLSLRNSEPMTLWQIFHVLLYNQNDKVTHFFSISIEFSNKGMDLSNWGFSQLICSLAKLSKWGVYKFLLSLETNK